MNIALDYDGTYTHDPVLWLMFVIQAQHNGHDIRLVTMRFASEEHGGAEAGGIDPRLRALGVQIIFTSREAKGPAAAAQGFVADVWIDDNPRAINESAVQIWGTIKPEGQPHDPNFTKEPDDGVNATNP